VRNALILLTAVALLILVGGALNNGVVFDVDYVAGTARSVSLLWVAAVIAGLVFVVGLMAAYLARTAVFGQRRKLEAELQTTYERLREAESLAARPAPAPEADIVVAPAVAATVEEVAAGEATVVAASEEAATIVDTADATVVAGEAATAVAGADADVGEAEAETAAGVDTGEAGEATAVTMAGAAAEASPAAAGAAAEASPAADDATQADDAGDDHPASAT
jgi:hypothetical protein